MKTIGGIPVVLLSLLLIAALLSGCMLPGSTSAPSSPGSTAAAPAQPAGGTALSGGSGSAACSPVVITQTDGTPVSLPCIPGRIIAANANAAELLILMGAGDRIVGVTESTKSVPYVMDKIPKTTSIGDWQNPNIEQMLALKPDVVIAYSSAKPKNIDQITAANITIVTLDCYKLLTLASDARALGRLTGKMNEAEVYARIVEDTIGEVTGRVKGIRPDGYPKVYFEMYTDYTVAAPGSGAHERVAGAGGENIADDVMSSSARVNPEWVVGKQPEYILKVISATNTAKLEEVAANLKTRPGWGSIDAVKNNRVHAFRNDIMYGPRAYIGLVYVAQILHTAEFRDLHPREMLNEYATRYVPGTNTSIMAYP